jgi:hypothetical protein
LDQICMTELLADADFTLADTKPLMRFCVAVPGQWGRTRGKTAFRAGGNAYGI